MKRMKIKYSVLVWALCCGALAGCNSFLDVNPKGTVVQEKQFEDVQGYRDAMYGIYASMAKTGLYGKNLSWGFLDVLAQLFYSNYGYTDEALGAAHVYKYTDPYLEGLINNVWGEAYTCISYANNILENIENVNLSEDPDYSLIKGEAYGIRAFLHFDVLRLFCENIMLDPGAGGIPYAYHFDLKNKEIFTLKECYDNILEDLSKAEACLVNDNEMNPKAISEYQIGRGMHCNKYAVWALKARVFHYKGDLDSAAFYAEKVINSPELFLVDKSEYDDMERFPCGDRTSDRVSSEMIWGLYTQQLYSSYKELFIEAPFGGVTLSPREDLENIFEVWDFSGDSEDLRYFAFFSTSEWSSSKTFTRLLNIDEAASSLQGICLIRLPEMYYILAEATYEKDQAKAVRYLNDVRNSRGLADVEAYWVETWEDFKYEFVAERTREFWGEGQMFFWYKRDNAAIEDADTWSYPVVKHGPSSEIYVLPWPKKELEYGGNSK